MSHAFILHTQKPVGSVPTGRPISGQLLVASQGTQWTATPLPSGGPDHSIGSGRPMQSTSNEHRGMQNA